jgi:hypothetical protein
MSGPLAGILGIFAMLAGLFLLRIPAAFVMAMVGFAGFALLTSFRAALGMIGTEIWNLFSSYGLTVIPMFILVGEIVFYAGYNDNLYNAAHRWFGRYRGGLAVTTIIASAAFAAICAPTRPRRPPWVRWPFRAMKKFHNHPVFNAGQSRGGDPRRRHPPQRRPHRLRALHRAVHRQTVLRGRQPRHASRVLHGPHGVHSVQAQNRTGGPGGRKAP